MRDFLPEQHTIFDMFALASNRAVPFPPLGELGSNAPRLPIVWAKLFPFVRNVVTWRATSPVGYQAQVVEKLGLYRSNGLDTL